MRRWQYGTASSALAAVIAVGAVIATTEIEGRHPGSSPPVAAPSSQKPSRAHLTPVVRTSPRPSAQPSGTQPGGSVLAADLHTATASTPAPTEQPQPRPSHSQPAPQPSPAGSTPAPPPPPSPRPTPKPPAPSPSPTRAAPSPGSTGCVVGVNALGITVCIGG